jgi:outer membrane protein assembly factor BamB/predicted phosphodiesterase
MKIFFQILFLLSFSAVANCQFKGFRFAFISDTHIGSPNGGAEEDLRRTIADINKQKDVAFVVVTGDVTELGTDVQIKLAKQMLDSLNIPYYVIPGNHDTGWSESGGVSFSSIFGYDRFSFIYNGIKFLGCASGPYVRMSDGHVPREAVVWLDKELDKTPAKQPLIFLNHYPLDNSLDNWYEVTDRLKNKNIMVALCGHGHANSPRNWEGIPGVMGRSNLRAKSAIGGYNMVDVRNDSILFTERTPGIGTMRTWTKVFVEKHVFDTLNLVRPSYTINDTFPFVKAKWTYSSEANVISTPAVLKDVVVFGNSKGIVEALIVASGKKIWSFKTNGAIYSSPAVFKNNVIVGSGDGNIYAISNKGKQVWKFTCGAAVLGSPIVDKGTVYIGASDHQFRAIDARTGKLLWTFNGLKGPVVSKPLIDGDKIIFGAWDTFLYALQNTTGQLLWKWTNGSTVPNYSPAACTPVSHDGVVYIVAPDRYITAIDIETGTTLWRNNEATVRESIGISADGKHVYAKTMNDEVVAFATSHTRQSVSWKVNCNYGYDHVPSMLVENNGTVFFGTRLGVVYAINSATHEKTWAYKIDNSMVNTVNMLNRHKITASTMDGKVVMIKVGK